MTNATPERVNILNEAADLIVGQRQQDYGTPEENFTRMADLVNIHIAMNLATNTPLSPRQISEIMILLKLSRTINSPTHDSYVDIAGYAGIAGELAKAEESKTKVDSDNVSYQVGIHPDHNFLTSRIAKNINTEGPSY